MLLKHFNVQAVAQAKSSAGYDFPAVAVPAEISVPEIVVEKSYYTFRTESVRQINFDKHGEKMGFSSAEDY